jgi:hypothetical protein
MDSDLERGRQSVSDATRKGTPVMHVTMSQGLSLNDHQESGV